VGGFNYLFACVFPQESVFLHKLYDNVL
jgi:hypothetical protein